MLVLVKPYLVLGIHSDVGGERGDEAFQLPPSAFHTSTVACAQLHVEVYAAKQCDQLVGEAA
jgi:hypothetical protein